jgi:hypothetical protein
MTALLPLLLVLGALLFVTGRADSNARMAPFPRIDMPLNGSHLWDKFYADHGFKNYLHLKDPSRNTMYNNNSAADDGRGDEDYEPYKQVCSAFFGLWPSDCRDQSRSKYLQMSVRLINAQMQVMNASYYLFVTSTEKCEALMDKHVYSHVIVQAFNPRALLSQYGFRPVMRKIIDWGVLELMLRDKSYVGAGVAPTKESKHTVYARFGDILRICLALQYQYSYLDLDVHFLYLNSEPFFSAYAGAAVYSHERNNIEITNAAFCLPRPILVDMVKAMIVRIGRNESYFYTELGPALFHKVRGWCYVN